MIAALLLLLLLVTPVAATELFPLVDGKPVLRDKFLPDPTLTPGVSSLITTQVLCSKTFRTRDVRHVTAQMKKKVFSSYGLSGNAPTDWCKPDRYGRIFEIDHLLPLSLGGANEQGNLWPQCFSGEWNAVKKDKLEVHLTHAACGGHISLDDAQYGIRSNWIEEYRRYFPE